MGESLAGEKWCDIFPQAVLLHQQVYMSNSKILKNESKSISLVYAVVDR